jgi:hypothetical protein
MIEKPQEITIPITFVFTTAQHSPDSDFMLYQVVCEFLRSKGVTMENDTIRI